MKGTAYDYGKDIVAALVIVIFIGGVWFMGHPMPSFFEGVFSTLLLLGLCLFLKGIKGLSKSFREEKKTP